MTPEFAKSQIGKKFLTNDIPQLVVALNKLTEAMTESNKIEEKKLLIEQKRYLNEQKHARITGSSEDGNEPQPEN
jgi:hypothetical protein